MFIKGKFLREKIYGNIAPEFNITIIEENLYSILYTIEEITRIFSVSELNGIIDQDVWNDLPQGEIVITFYAQDQAGNIGTISVTVIKSIPSSSAIPGYNLFFLLGIISIVSIVIAKKIKKQ